MRNISPSQALEFVESAELPPPPAVLEDMAESTGEFDFDKSKTQALVVGSEIVSFVKGVTEDRRRDIVHSTLLAQLVAKKRVTDRSKIFEWYDAYFEALENIGWVTQTTQFDTHTEQGDTFQAHNAIISVATTLLGPGAAALQVVKATLDALRSMEQNSPWITLFNQESQHASSARFQITLADQDEAGQFLVTLMAFGLEAKATLTQVLFFRFRSNDVKLKHSCGKITIDEPVLAAVRDAIEQKLAVHTAKFIKGLPDLD